MGMVAAVILSEEECVWIRASSFFFCRATYLGDENHRQKKMALMRKNPQAVLLATSMGCKEKRNSRASGGSKSFIRADVDSM